jgi:hypothetical protein
VPLRVEPEVERHPLEDVLATGEVPAELELDPVRTSVKFASQPADPSVLVCSLRAEPRLVDEELDRDAGGRPPAGDVEHVRRDGGRQAAASVQARGEITNIVSMPLTIQAGPVRFTARLEVDAAPRTVAAFRSLLPLRSKIIQARWSGEAAWIPFGDLDLGLDHENHTSYPSPGQILLYPGGVSETEILFPYGGTRFASKVGQLAGNHFATIVDGLESLPELGRLVTWEGAQDIVFQED